MECEEAVRSINDGDDVSVDFSTGIITNETKNEQYTAMPFPEFITNIIEKGGLLQSIKSEKEA